MPNLIISDLRPSNRPKKVAKQPLTRPSSASSFESLALQNQSQSHPKQLEIQQLSVQLAEQSAMIECITRENLELRKDRETVWRIASIFKLHGTTIEEEVSLNQRLEEFCRVYERQAQQEYTENNIMKRDLDVLARQLGQIVNTKDLQLSYRVEHLKKLQTKVEKMEFQTTELRKSVLWWRRERGLHQQQIEQLEKLSVQQKQEISGLNQVVASLKAELAARPKAELEKLTFQMKQQAVLLESQKQQIQSLRQAGVENEIMRSQRVEMEQLIDSLKMGLREKNAELSKQADEIQRLLRETTVSPQVYNQLESAQQTIESLREQLQQAATQRGALQNDREKLFLASITEQSNEELQWAVQTLKQQLASSKNVSSQRSEELLAGLRAFSGEHGQVSSIKNELICLRRSLEEGDSVRDSTFAEAGRAIQKLMTTLRDQTSTFTAATKKMAGLEAANKQLENSLEASKTQAKEFAEKAAAKERELGSLRAKRDSMIAESTRQQLMETSQLVQSVLCGQDAKPRPLNSPSLQLSRSSAPVGSEALEIHKLTGERDKALAEVEELNSRLQAFVKRHGEIKRGLLAQIETLQTRLSQSLTGNSYQEYETLKADQERQRAFVVELQAQARALELVSSQKDDRIRQLDSQKAEFQDSQNRAKQQAAQKEALFAKLEGQMTSEIRQLRDKLACAQQHAEEADLARQVAEEKNSQLRITIQQQNIQIQEIQKTNLGAYGEVSAAAQRLQDVQEKCVQLQRELEAARTGSFKANEQVAIKSQEIVKLQQKIAQQQEIIEELQQALIHIQEDNQLKDQLNLALKQRAAEAARAQLDAELTINQQTHQLAELQQLKHNQKLATQLLEAAAVQSLLLETQADGIQLANPEENQ